MESKKVFFILSVVYFKNRRLSYSKTRSKFNPEERAKQTAETIASIRQKAPGAKILLFESGLRKALPCNLEKLADRYVYLGGNFLVRLSCDSIFKGLGEAVALMFAKRYIVREDADFYFKVCSRYCLNENFNMADWEKGNFVCRMDGKSISTRLYGFRKVMMSVWFYSLVKSIPLLLLNRSIEQTMPKFISKNDIHRLSRLGIFGYGSAFGEFYNE
jgi:hypothetical protein